MINSEDILRLFLPSWLFDCFELEKFTQDSFRIDIYLSEKKLIPQEASERLISHGFTDYSIIQDFPVKGKAVYRHLRRRKWLNSLSLKNPFSCDIEIKFLREEQLKNKPQKLFFEFFH